jgi:SAM-dependent methyltransferase
MNSQRDRFGNPQWVKSYEYRVGSSAIIPFLSKRLSTGLDAMQVLDLGCGSGGVLMSMAEAGAVCTGMDRNVDRINAARLGEPDNASLPRFVVGDILEPLPFEEAFDLVLLVEVIEHLQSFGNVERVLKMASELVAPKDGRLFVSFPPWYSPFGGHQAGWPVLTYLPWVHLWPKSALRRLAPSRYLEFIQGELNQISISAFEQCVHRSGLEIEHRALFLLRPEYATRYGVPTILQIPFLKYAPLLRELLTTGAYYLLRLSNR